MRRFSPPSPECELSSTIQWIDLAKSNSFVEHPFSAPFGTGAAVGSVHIEQDIIIVLFAGNKVMIEKNHILHVPSGNLMRLNTSISESTATNGPRKHIGGGNSAQSAANAGGCGNVPPANGCSYGYGFDFGLYGIICEKSGLGSWHTTSSFSMADAFGVNNPVCCRFEKIY